MLLSGSHVTLALIGFVSAVIPCTAAGNQDDEAAFRAAIEARKDRLLSAAANAAPLRTAQMVATARKNASGTAGGKAWLADQRKLADYIVAQPDSWIDSMVPELTPSNPYGFTCPNCVNVKSQECTGSSLYEWDYRKPDQIRCKACGQIYPDPRFPEDGKLECPRTGQTFTFYYNNEERLHPEDRTGKYAWHWLGRMPIHVSFIGAIRHAKAQFAVAAIDALANTYEVTGDERYAGAGIRMLLRLTKCYRNWLYHDYFDTYADCDPMYAAWHSTDFPREWKRHACSEAFADDRPGRGSMLQTYWGAGRIHPSTDNISLLAGVCESYGAFQRLMTPQQAALISRDLLLEWLMGAEPYLGGEGKAGNLTNKSPRVYLAMAAVGRTLGIPEFVETALKGYEGIRDESFGYDGMSRESPAYTSMYLGNLVELTDVLDGYTWPDSYVKRKGTIDLYGKDSRLQLMFRSMADQLDGSGRLLPLSDTMVGAGPDATILEIGQRRYPQYFGSRQDRRVASEYAAYNLDLHVAKPKQANLPELFYPGWMTAVLRNGGGSQSPVLAMALNPQGTHRHEDNLGIYYQDGGVGVLGELGYVGDMPTKPWAGSTLGHNLVVVDDSDQRFKDRAPQLRFMATTPRVSVVEACSDVYKQCSQYRRTVALIKGPAGQSFAVDIFRVTGGRKHAYQVLSELASSDKPGSALVFDGVSVPSEPPFANLGAGVEKDIVYGLRDTRTAVPTSTWQATWSQNDRSYRLWMLSNVDRVEASNGPGQTTRDNAGRRLRYVSAICEGSNLNSTFVAVHEPGATGKMPVRSAVRLQAPAGAGPNAVAAKIECACGVYYVFSDFDHAATIDGIDFRGQFGVLCTPRAGGRWLMTVGAESLRTGDFGFAGKSARWSGSVSRQSTDTLTCGTSRPTDWPVLADDCRSYVTVTAGQYTTGLAATHLGTQQIRVDRFPLPPSCGRFDWPALRYMEER